jgi:hypothetical protein
MKSQLLTALAVSLSMATYAHALDYNEVPAGDEQFKQCKIYAMSKWEGGGEASPIPGQSKAEAFCICMWNETPDDFKGSLAKFSETEKGAKTNALCEKHSNWHSD